MSRIVLAGLLVPLVLAKVAVTLQAAGMGVDGGYFTDVALHVSQGHGWVTDVSLYHKGYPSLPHPTSVYPLWPGLMGLALTVLPLTLAAWWLPALLYTASLGAAFGAGRKLWPGEVLPGIHGGHLLALMLGLHGPYGIYTSLPYTEGLSYLLLMTFLWRLPGLATSRRLRAGVEIGAWSSLLLLCRGQFLLVPLALGCAWGVAILFGEDRRRVAAQAALGTAIPVLVGGAWWWHVSGFLEGAGPLALLRFDQAQASHLLAPLAVMQPTSGLWDLLVDRLPGLVVAWEPGSRFGYSAAFFGFEWALPAAIPVALVGLYRGVARKGPGAALRAIASRENASRLMFVMLALGGLASIHLAHKVYLGEWFFHRRQALVCLFAFYGALVLLLTAPGRLPRAVGLGVLVLGTLVGGATLFRRAVGMEPVRIFGGRDTSELVDWLQSTALADPGLVVALSAQDPQRVAWQTEGVGYHWFHSSTSYQDLLHIFDDLGTDRLVFHEKSTAEWVFRSDPDRLLADFQEEENQVSGYAIYVRREASP